MREGHKTIDMKTISARLKVNLKFQLTNGGESGGIDKTKISYHIISYHQSYHQSYHDHHIHINICIIAPRDTLVRTWGRNSQEVLLNRLYGPNSSNEQVLGPCDIFVEPFF